MQLKRKILFAVLAAAAVAVWGFQAGAYSLVSTDGMPQEGNCNQCHTFQGANHDFHTGAGVACAACHGDFSEQVATSACAGCHPTAGYPDEGIFALHDSAEAPNGDYCGYCHEGVGAEHRSWTELKNIFD
jgi:hypothetical protein